MTNDELKEPGQEHGGPELDIPHSALDVSWTVHRARETPVRTAVAASFLVFFLAVTFWQFGLLLFLVALVVLSLALHTYFLPVTYVFNQVGVTVDKRVFKYTYPWDRFRRYFRTSGGVVLSPFTRRTFLDNFRGVHLLLPADSEPVIDYLEKRFAPRPTTG